MVRKDKLGAFDVRESFAMDPLGCIDDPKKRSVLREQDFGWRPWVGLPYDIRRAGPVTPERWAEGYWDSLSGYLQELSDPKLGPRFADYLVGYVLVVENETPSRNYVNGHSSITRRRTSRGPKASAKRSRELRRLKRIVGSPSTCRPQRGESLKQILSSAMAEELVATGLTRKFVCEERLPRIWAAVGVEMKSASALRMERRSRSVRSQTK